MTGPVVVLGDTLLDVDLHGAVERDCPDTPGAPVLDLAEQCCRPGGAGLAASLAVTDGAPVRLVTALADDGDAELLRDVLDPRIELVAGRSTGTTAVKCRLRAAGQSVARLDRGSGGCAPSTSRMREALAGASAVLVSDYGRGVAADPGLRAALRTAAHQIPLIWDPHPRGAAPVPAAALVTPNLDEAVRASGRGKDPQQPGRVPEMAAELAARRLRRRWSAAALAVTLGSRGALLDRRGQPIQVLPAPQVVPADACGAGDRFAAAAALAMRNECDQARAVADAVAAAAEFIAAGGAARLGTVRSEGSAGSNVTLERRRA